MIIERFSGDKLSASICASVEGSSNVTSFLRAHDEERFEFRNSVDPLQNELANGRWNFGSCHLSARCDFF